MANNKELDFEEGDLDNLDNLFDDNFDGDQRETPPKNKREAISRAVKKFGSGAKDEVASTDRVIGTLLDKGLPDKLSGITSGNDQIVGSLKDSYKESLKTLRPQLSNITKTIDKAVPEKFTRIKKLTGKLSDGFSDKKYQSKEASIDEIVADKLEESLGGLRKKEEIENLLKEDIENNKHKQNITLLGEISAYQKASFDFNRERTAVYQRKHLELLYRILYINKAQLDQIKEDNKTSKQQLEGILSNTAMPEIVKIRNTERFKEIVRDSVFSTAQTSMFGDNNWIKTAGERIKNKAKNFSSDLASSLDMLSMGSEMAGQADEYGIDKGSMLGSLAAGGIMGAGASKLAKWLDSNPKTKNALTSAAAMYQNAPERLDAYLQSQGATDQPTRRKLAGMLYSLIRPESKDTAINIDEYDSDGGAIFDGRAHISLVKIIPGILGRIHGELNSLRTGGEPSTLMYDYKNDSFKTNKVLRKELGANIRKEITDSGFSGQVDRFLDTNLKGMDVDPKSRSKVKRALISQLLEDGNIDYRVLESRGFFKDLPKEVQDSFKSSYDEDAIKQGDELARLKRYMPDVKAAVALLVKNGYKDLLVEDGILTITGPNDYKINIRKFRKLLFLPSEIKEEEKKKDLMGSVKSFIKRKAKEIKIEDTQKIKIQDRIDNATDYSQEQLRRARGYVEGKVGKIDRGRIDDVVGAGREYLTQQKKRLIELYSQANTAEQREAIINAIPDPILKSEIIAKATKYTTGALENSRTAFNQQKQKLINLYAKVKTPEQRKEIIDSIKDPELRAEIIGSVKSSVKTRVTEVVKQIDDLTDREQARLEQLVEKHGISTLVEKGVISSTGSGKPLVNTKGFTGISAISSESQARSTQRENVVENDLNTKVDTHLLLMNQLLAKVDVLTEAVNQVMVFSPTGHEEKETKKGPNLVSKTLNMLGEKGKGFFGRLRGLGGGSLNLLKKLNPTNMISGMFSGIGKVGKSIMGLGGLVNPIYRALLAPLSAVSGIASNVLGYMTRGIVKIPSLMSKAYSGAKSIGRTGLNLFMGDDRKIPDLYTIDNQEEPILRANIAAAGFYIDAKTQKQVKRISDIKGTIVDLEGNVILTQSDLNKGLYTKNGKEIRLGDGIRSGLLSGGIKLIKNLFKKSPVQIKLKRPRKLKSLGIDFRTPDIRNIAKDGDSGVLMGIYQENVQRTTILADIHRILSTMVSSKAFNDSDGDNIRDGSWRNMLKRNKKKKDKEEKIKKKKEGKGTNWLGMLSSLAGLASSGLNIASNLLNGFLGKILGVLGTAGGMGGLAALLKKTLGRKVPNLGLKNVGKFGLKSGLKKIPAISLLAGAGFGINRLLKGQYKEAGLEALSGVAGSFPGLGTGTSLAIDAQLGYMDHNREFNTGGSIGDLPNAEDSETKPRGSMSVRSKVNQGRIPMLNTPLQSPSDGANHITLKPGVKLNGLNPAMKELFLAMASEYGQLTGKRILVDSAYRTLVHNKSMCKNQTNKSCSPRSMHVHGLAIDIPSATANHLEKLGLMRKYGFTRPIGGEAWHIEPAMTQLDLERARNDPQWATSQILLSPGRGGGGYGTMSSARKSGRDIKVAQKALELNSSQDVTMEVTGKSKAEILTIAAKKDSPISAIEKRIGYVDPAKTTRQSFYNSGGLPTPVGEAKPKFSPSRTNPLGMADTKTLDRIEVTLEESLEVQKEELVVAKESLKELMLIRDKLQTQPKITEVPKTETIKPNKKPTPLPRTAVGLLR